MAEISLNPDPLTPERMKAGADYLDALKRGGVQPEGLAWAVDMGGEFHLLMITSLVDRVGPKVVYDTLFKAYDAAVTPKDIDPWIVTAFSAKSNFGEAFLTSMDIKVQPHIDPDGQVREFAFAALDIGPFKIRENWIYIKKKPVTDSEAQLRGWRRFKRETELRAA